MELPPSRQMTWCRSVDGRALNVDDAVVETVSFSITPTNKSVIRSQAALSAAFFLPGKTTEAGLWLSLTTAIRQQRA
jgi:hypothetical protein